MDSGLEEISDAELLDLAMTNRLIDLHVAMPARVEAYHVDTQTVDVVPMLNRSLPDGQGNFVSESLPKLGDVPVAFPRCKGFALTFPLQAGDFVLVVFAERSLGAWRATGQAGDPGDLGMHTLDGAVALPGLYPDSSLAQSASSSNLVLGAEGDSAAQIEITPHEIHLGAGATDGVANGVTVEQQLQALQTALNGWTPVSQDGGAALKAALTTAKIIGPGSTWGTGIKSTKVKAVK